MSKVCLTAPKLHVNLSFSHPLSPVSLLLQPCALTATNSTGYQKFFNCSSISRLLFRPLLRRCTAATFVSSGAGAAAAPDPERVEAPSPLLARRARSSAS